MSGYENNTLKDPPVDPTTPASIGYVNSSIDEVVGAVGEVMREERDRAKKETEELLATERQYVDDLVDAKGHAAAKATLKAVTEGMLHYCEAPATPPTAGNILAEPNPKSMLCEKVKRKTTKAPPEDWYMRLME